MRPPADPATAERQGRVPAGGLRDSGDALWWTAMVMTTMGSAYRPVMELEALQRRLDAGGRQR